LASIRIEYVPIERFFLGYFFLDHIHLTFAQSVEEQYAQDSWLVIEGVQDGSIFGGTLGVTGQNGDLTLADIYGARGEALIAAIGTPETRGTRVIVEGVDALSTWDVISFYGADIEAQQLPYIAASWPFSATPTVNSTSVIASLLWWAGYEISTVMPYGIRLSPGGSTLLGSSADDELQASETFTTILGGGGNDVIRGFNNLIWIEKLYGGEGDDTLYWSYGENILHGGQPGLAYVNDGLDTVDYAGAGTVYIVSSKHAVEHKVADYRATFEGGSDQLFSIEQVAWDTRSDRIIAGEGVTLLEKPLVLDMQGSASGLDDRFDMTGSTAPLIINAVNNTAHSIQTVSNSGLDAGFWVRGIEWLTGSESDDRIYAGPSVRVVEGGDGNDLIDARLAEPGSGASPLGYDIELYGGDGKDILVAGPGRTYAHGGSGADVFVLSTMADGTLLPEFIIADADVTDRLYIPYDFFQNVRGDFDGSPLLQVSGAPFAFDDVIVESFFEWGNPGPAFDIELFVGMLSFTLDGSDLLVHVIQGFYEEFTEDFGDDGVGETFISFVGETVTLTTIRVLDWSDGVLGISFPLTWDIEIFDQLPDYYDYPGLREIMAEAITAERFLDPLELRPDPHVPLEIASLVADPAASSALRSFSFDTAVTDGGDGDDVLFAGSGGPYRFFGGAGNDDITGSNGGDVIDGGSGDDIMRGGRGNDTYYVDSPGDQVIEEAGGGFDRIISSIDWTLGPHVEHLRLTGNAVTGIGNELRNIIEGNDGNNILYGGDGDDTLAGLGGDDILYGGNGSDGYVYGFGDGNDTIIDTGTGEADEDVLVLAGLFPVDAIRFTRDSETSPDLVLRFSDGGSIRLVDQLLGNGRGIEAIEFSDGRVWNAADIAELASAAAITTNAAPRAEDDLYAIQWQPQITVPGGLITANDEDPDGDLLSLLSISNIVGGTAFLNGDGNVVVTPLSYVSNASIRFDYVVSDGRGGTSSATFELALLPPDTAPNTPPVAEDDTGFSVISGGTLLVSAGELLANDRDGDGDALTITNVTPLNGGTAQLTSSGDIIFTPDSGFSGPATFSYDISDGRGGTASATVEIDVLAATPNLAPVIYQARLNPVREDQTANGRIKACDPEGDHVTFMVSPDHGPSLGTVTFGANGKFSYTPFADVNGREQFTVLVRDSLGATTEHVFDFTIAAVNDRPVANDDFGFVAHGRNTLRIEAASLLANDVDIDGDNLTIFNVSKAAGNKVWIDNNGDILFQAGKHAMGDAEFTYRITDGNGGTSSATVHLSILPEIL
jgi:Ca2+-binding RTX toxin-like protein